MEPLKLNVNDIVAISRESKSIVFDAIQAGHLKTFLVGRRRFARPADVARWVDFLEKQSDKGKPVKYRPKVKEAA